MENKTQFEKGTCTNQIFTSFILARFFIRIVFSIELGLRVVILTEMLCT